MELYISLHGRNARQVDALIAALNAPGSPIYRRYLTPQQYGAYFGADPARYAAAIASLRRAGFTIEALPANRTDILASAPASVVSAYFQTPIDLRSERGRIYFANRFVPAIPRELDAEAISGLDDYVTFHPHWRVRPYALSGGEFSWAPADLAAAYDLGPLYAASPALDGKGVTIANATCGAASPSDLAQFQRKFRLPRAALVSTGTGGALQAACASYGNGESTLDVDSALGVAREATFHQVVAHGPANALFDKSYSYIVNDLGASVHVVTTSWGTCERDMAGTPSLTIDEKLFAQAATEGQAWFSASGDNGTDDCEDGKTALSVDFPGSSPYVTSVGGTNVTAAISHGSVTAWRAESAWQYANSNGASGGGKSILFPKPPFQARLTPKDGTRDVPDVALLADDLNDGMWIYQGGRLQSGWGGTSEAAPQWAGLLAIVVQRYRGAAVERPNARLYDLAGTSAYAQLFHDVRTGTNAVPARFDPYGAFAGFQAGPGFDLCTGLGSYVGAKLVMAY